MRAASWAAGAVVVAALTIFFGWPVASMIARGLSDDGTFTLAGYAQTLGDARTWWLIGNTLGMALAAAAGSVLLGVPTACILYRRRLPGRVLLRGLISVPFVLPTVVVGIAFRALLGRDGPLGWLGLDQTTPAVVLAMVFFNVSLVARQVGGFWRTLDGRLAEAARTLGASGPRAFFTVTLPQLRPAIASAAVLVFLFCATAFGIVLTLGTPRPGTLETEIYTQTIVFLDLRTAAVLSTVQLVIVVAALAISLRLTRRTDTAVAQRDVQPARLGWQDAPAVAATAVAVALVLAPLVTLVVRSLRADGAWSLHNFAALARSGEGFAGGVTPAEGLANSLQYAVTATALTLLISVPLALLLSRRVRGVAAAGQRILDIGIMLPLGVSAVTLGFGYLVTLQTVAPDLAFSGALVPFAQAVIALPLVVRALVPAMRAINPRLRDAAATLGAPRWRILATIDGPVLARAIGIGAGFAFAVSLGEFGATSFLASPARVTLPILISRLLGRPGGDNYGAALAGAVVLAGLCAVVMLGSELLRPRNLAGGAW